MDGTAGGERSVELLCSVVAETAIICRWQSVKKHTGTHPLSQSGVHKTNNAFVWDAVMRRPADEPKQQSRSWTENRELLDRQSVETLGCRTEKENVRLR